MSMKIQSSISKHSQTNKVPKYWHILCILPILFRRGLRTLPEFKRFLKENKFPIHFALVQMPDFRESKFLWSQLRMTTDY